MLKEPMLLPSTTPSLEKKGTWKIEQFKNLEMIYKHLFKKEAFSISNLILQMIRVE